MRFHGFYLFISTGRHRSRVGRNGLDPAEVRIHRNSSCDSWLCHRQRDSPSGPSLWEHLPVVWLKGVEKFRSETCRNENQNPHNFQWSKWQQVQLMSAQMLCRSLESILQGRRNLKNYIFYMCFIRCCYISVVEWAYFVVEKILLYWIYW